ncbi:MAG: PIN domain-containing protein [Haloechinothrix sp.]
MYRAVLDTCALVPGRQRDFLLQLAAEEAYAPLWGSGILVELDYVLARLDAKRGREDSSVYRKRLFEQMKRAFPGAEINSPKDRNYEYGLSDPDDGHVAHAALLGKADAIVTDDTRAGFKASPTLLDAGIEVVYPHEFAASTVSAHPQAGVRALVAMSRRMTEPPKSPRELLEELQERYGMAEVAAILGPELARPGS